MILLNLLHIFSPFLYILFVFFIKKITPCPDSIIMKYLRFSHNIFLSLSSFIMLISIIIANIETNKIYPLNNLLCLPYNNNLFANKSTELFLYSKYVEWGDTLFLHLSGKPISMLQYTHHMTTAILMYSNMIEYISPHIFIFMGLNCFVHIFMYWYFAYPRGFLFKYRKYITQFQILQHIICLLTIIYTNNLNNCNQNKYGNIAGLIAYLMYLFYFLMFYIKSYISSNNKSYKLK